MKKFNYGKIFLLGFGFFGVSVIWGIYNAFVPIFLANRFNLSPVWIGFFRTLDNIAALLIQPPVGAWSDRLRTPIGRRMPFILIGAPIGALAFGIIPIAAVLPLFVACTSTLLLSMAFWRTPVVALMPDLTPSENRSQANGIINFMGGVGAIISYLLGASLYKMNPAYPFWLGSVLVLVATGLLFAFIREPRDFPKSDKEPSMLESLKELIKDPDSSGIRLLWAIFFWFIGYSAIEAFFSLYVNKYLGLEESEGARLLGQLSLLFVIFALPAGKIGASLGRRKTIFIGLIGMIACVGTIFLLQPSVLITGVTRLPVLGAVPVLGLILMVAGVSWSLININSLPMVVDMTEPARVGTFTGLYYLFSTLSAIVGPNLMGWVVQLSGRNYNALMAASPIFFVVALVLMWGVKKGEAVQIES
jgi:maltose/moltooligosaccharide transporter